MSTRLADGGRRIDRSEKVEFTFNGKRMHGFAGDTLAAALLANDQVMMGRSFKYHRPRGVVASGAEEPNALVNLGEGARFEPNQRAIRSYQKAGFIIEGKMRDAQYRNGSFVDVLLMSVLRPEWETER